MYFWRILTEALDRAEATPARECMPGKALEVTNPCFKMLGRGPDVTVLCCLQVLYYVRSWLHIEALWFANVANQLMWYALLEELPACLPLQIT